MAKAIVLATIIITKIPFIAIMTNISINIPLYSLKQPWTSYACEYCLALTASVAMKMVN